MKHLKYVASAGAVVLGVGTLVLGLGATGAQASTDSFHLYGQINSTALQPTPDDLGTNSMSMTVTPSTATPYEPIEVSVTSPDLTVLNGPAASVNANQEELDAVISLGGTDYTLRGPQNKQNVAANDGTTADGTGSDNSLFNKGWTVSSTAGHSSGASTNTAPTGTTSDGVSVTHGTVAGTTGLGTSKRGAETSIVPLLAPSTDATYPVTLKAIVLNTISGTGVSPKITDKFDETINVASTGTAAALTNNTASSYIDFSTPVDLDVAGTGTSPTASATPTSTSTSTSTGSALPSPVPTASKTYPKVYCQVNNTAAQPTPVAYSDMPFTMTVSPSQVRPGKNVKVSISVAKSFNNGPAVEIDPKTEQLDAVVSYNGKDYTFLGPKNQHSVAINGPLFTASELPAVITGTLKASSKTGQYPVVLKTLWINDTQYPSFTFTFDEQCNLSSTSPIKSPVAYGLTVKFNSDPNAPESSVKASASSSSDPTTTAADASSGSLAATGGRQILIVGLLALVVIQIGAVFTVRAVRAGPKSGGPRHL